MAYCRLQIFLQDPQQASDPCWQPAAVVGLSEIVLAMQNCHTVRGAAVQPMTVGSAADRGSWGEGLQPTHWALEPHTCTAAAHGIQAAGSEGLVRRHSKLVPVARAKRIVGSRDALH